MDGMCTTESGVQRNARPHAPGVAFPHSIEAPETESGGAVAACALAHTIAQLCTGFRVHRARGDALVGDKGLLDTIRARRQFATLSDALAHKRQENARLRDEIRRLNNDASTIETLAREELGLMRSGEVLFIVRDAKQR